DAQLGALQVAQYRDRAVELLLQRADRLDDPGVGLVVAVAHVDAEGVGPGLEQPAKHVRVPARRAHGGEDLDLAASRFELCRHPPRPMAEPRDNSRTLACPTRSTTSPTQSLPPPFAGWCVTCATA